MEWESDPKGLRVEVYALGDDRNDDWHVSEGDCLGRAEHSSKKFGEPEDDLSWPVVAATAAPAAAVATAPASPTAAAPAAPTVAAAVTAATLDLKS